MAPRRGAALWRSAVARQRPRESPRPSRARA